MKQTLNWQDLSGEDQIAFLDDFGDIAGRLLDCDDARSLEILISLATQRLMELNQGD